MFQGIHFNQQLSVCDGVMTLRGDGVILRRFAWPERDVIAVELDDQREHPAPVTANLRTLRYLRQIIRGRQSPPADPRSNTLQTGAQTATSTLVVQEQPDSSHAGIPRG